MAASTYFAQIQQLYIAYFGRPADPVGQAYWAGQVDAANGSIASVIAGFSASTESAALFGNKSSIDKVTAIYQNAFGRAPEPAGLAYWVAQLDSGKVSQAQASWTIQQSAGPGDAAAVQNKLTAAQAFTAQIDTTAEIQGYQGSAAADSARAFLKTVTADNATATAAVNGAAAAVAAATSVGVTGTTFTLTAGADNIVGTANADTINAVVDGAATQSTLTAADKIAGGAGIDTLAVTVVNGAANVTNGADISGLEVVSIRNTNATTAGTATLSNAAGLTAVNVVRGSGDVVVTGGLAQGATIGIDGTTGGTVGATYVASATSATLNVTNAATAGAINLAGTGLTSVAINSTVGANTLGGVAVGAAVTAVTIDATSNLTTGGITGVAANAAITVKGAGSVNLGALAANVASVDASANLGGVTTTLNAATTTKFVGSAGNDVVTTGATYVAADTASINAGAGTADRLIVALAADVATAAAGAKYQGFEVVQTTGQNLDLAFLSGINKIVAQGAVTLDHVTAAQSGNIVLNGGATATINVVGANTVGQIDTLKLAIDDEAAAVSTITVANVVASGVENVEFTANDNLILSSVLGLANASNFKFAGAGTLDVTFNAATLVNTKIDASASTGTVAINASTTTGANGVEIIGSATKANTLTGTANADKLTGGAGNDVLVGGAGADVLTGGAGANTFTFALPGAAGAVSAATADVITDWAAGTGNKIDFGATVLAATAHNVAAVAGTAAVSATGLATFAVADNTLALKLIALSAATATDVAGTAAVFTDSGNSYVFVNTDATGTNADTLIQLTGVNATTGLTFANGDITAVA